eukprot:TRINITY_DN2080_c0_g1_i1.p1 TRINITY_DN2080_c0_g1~~TRINITY_DN2080_c0_g1_i1.p1  ORF type:complete len:797 (+),score=175.95 TRINITY_DN2080_c0_g1_i1:124-2391(+)
MEMVLKTAQSQKDIEDNAPLFDASNKVHEVLLSLNIKTEETAQQNPYQSRVRQQPARVEGVITSYRSGTNVVVRDIKSVLSVMQAQAPKQEIPVLQEWARKIRDILLILDDAINDFESRQGVDITRVCTIKVKVAEAKNLRAKDITGTSDPYCVVFIDEEKRARTQTITKSLNPAWLQEYELIVKPEAREISFKVYDEDTNKKDDFIGQVMIDVEELKDGLPHEQWFNLSPKANRGEGSVRLILKYLPVAVDNLVVQVLSASKLGGSEFKGTMDAICKLWIGNPSDKSKGQTYSTTTIKNTINPIWAESFAFKLDPEQLSNDKLLLIVRLYNENKSGLLGLLGGNTKKKKRSFLGQISIPLTNIVSDAATDSHWDQSFRLYPKPAKEKDLGMIRLLMRYTEERIFPDYHYDQFFELISTDSDYLIDILNKLAPNTSEKKIILKSVVAAFESKGAAVRLIDRLSFTEIDKLPSADVLFRANSVASICLDSYLKITCVHLLDKTFRQLIREVAKSKKAWEVDPSKTKASSSDIKKNGVALIEKVKQIWQCIQDTVEEIPVSVREVFRTLQQRVKAKWPESKNARFSAVSGFMFLRFYCAAILGPQLFNITDEPADEEGNRNLTLISKILMSLANLASFDVKDNYLSEHTAAFFEENIPKMRQYLDTAATVPAKPIAIPRVPIYWGKEMAHIQDFLSQGYMKIREFKAASKNEAEAVFMGKLCDELDYFEDLLSKHDDAPQRNYAHVGTIHHAEIKKE